ncbi:unnamed protein product [Symbiodinium sp. CCMP2592]|nr:unnamed protein product [Symbiodinium sp. CCMP2592]
MRSLALNRLWGSESADAGTAAPDAVANSDARVVQLEAALAEERRRSVQKDEELQKMQKLMAKLESHIEQQAKDSDQEHKRLSSLETVLSQKREAEAEESDKVKRLVLALAETKRLKETAEKTAIDEGERASRLERQVSDMKKTDFFSADMQPVANSNNAEEELQRLREECAAEQQKREDAEVRERMQRAKMEQLETQLSEATARQQVADGVAIAKQLEEKEQRVQELLQRLSMTETALREPSELMLSGDAVVADLHERLNSEEKRRRETEGLVADREGELKHLRQRLSGEEKERQDRDQQLQQFETSLRDVKREKSEVLTRLSAKESQIVELQRQLAEELAQRQEAQKHLVEKERAMKDMRELPLERLSAQQAVQEQVIEKEREVCSLQQQLADELSKRQAVQYQIIEKDRVICELQSQISEQSSTTGPPEGYNADGTILQPIEEDGTLSAEGYGSISVAASVAASTAQATPKKLPPWLNSHSVRQSVPISTPASATRNTAEGLADDPWRDCEDIAREDMISFLADFARLKQYEDAQAWAHEALLRLDDDWTGDIIRGGVLPGIESSNKASDTRVRQLRGWGCPATDKTIELCRSSFQSESTMSSSGSQSTAPSGYSIGSSHADSGPMSPLLWRNTERPLKGWGSPGKTRRLPKMPRGWEPVDQRGPLSPMTWPRIQGIPIHLSQAKLPRAGVMGGSVLCGQESGALLLIPARPRRLRAETRPLPCALPCFLPSSEGCRSVGTEVFSRRASPFLPVIRRKVQD